MPPWKTDDWIQVWLTTADLVAFAALAATAAMLLRLRQDAAQAGAARKGTRRALGWFALLLSSGSIYHAVHSVEANSSSGPLVLACGVIVAIIASVLAASMPHVAPDILADFTGEATRAREERERGWTIRAFDNMPLGIARVATDDRFTYCNAEVERILGRTSAEITGGLRWQDVTLPEDVGVDQKQVNAIRDGSIMRYTLDKHYIQPGGTVVPVQIIVYRDPGGHEGAYLVYIEDQTKDIEEKESTRKLLDAQAKKIERLSKRAEHYHEASVELAQRITGGNLEEAHRRVAEMELDTEPNPGGDAE